MHKSLDDLSYKRLHEDPINRDDDVSADLAAVLAPAVLDYSPRLTGQDPGAAYLPPTQHLSGGASPSGYDSPSWKDMLKPNADSKKLKGSVKSSIFNLVSTIMGGGVLSMSYALAQSGVVVGSVLLLVIGIVNAYTMALVIDLSMLCPVSSRSFPGVAKLAFGRFGEIMMSLLVLILTFFTVVAYIILLGDMSHPLISLACGHHDGCQWLDERNMAVLLCLLLVFPMICQKDMSSLRFTSLLSMISVVFLAGIIFVSYVRNPHPKDDYLTTSKGTVVESGPVKYLNLQVEMLLSLSIFSVAFLCHFNVITVHNEMRRSTPQRVMKVITTTISTSTFVYIFIGVFGYLQWRGVTSGDIVNMYSATNEVVSAGRAAFAMVLMLNLPLLVNPCRHSFHQLFINPESDLQESALFRVFLSLCIVGACFGITIKIKAIVVVWSFVGSTCAVLMAVVLPALFCLRIYKRGLIDEDWETATGIAPRNHIKMSRVLVVVGILLVGVCTGEAINNALNSKGSDK